MLRRFALLLLLIGTPLVATAERHIQGRELVEAFTASGKVSHVFDGDTLDLRIPSGDVVRVRISGIDAPERGQPCSRVSKDALASLVLDKAADIACAKVDRYGRRVCNVTTGGGDVGLEMIQKGLAWHFKRYAAEQPGVRLTRQQKCKRGKPSGGCGSRTSRCLLGSAGSKYTVAKLAANSSMKGTRCH